MANRIKKAIIPIAGYGTRMLPITKTVPKEMLNVYGRPVIDYVIQEAIDAGIEQIILVTNKHKHMVTDYYEAREDLEAHLRKTQQDAALYFITKSNKNPGFITTVTQTHPGGLCHAIYCAKNLIEKDEKFVVMLPDVIFMQDEGVNLKSIMSVSNWKWASTNPVILTEVKTKEQLHAYGVVETGTYNKDIGASPITSFVEKPKNWEKSEIAPTITGRYIFNEKIFDLMEDRLVIDAYENRETQLVDILSGMSCLAVECVTKSYDCGNRDGLLDANISAAMHHKEAQRNSIF